MSFRVVLTARAEFDRDAAFDWYAANYSPTFAERWYRGFSNAVQSLRHHPARCGLAHESDKFPFELRELLYGNRRNKHRILFAIQDDVVAILHVRHSAQRDLTEDDM